MSIAALITSGAHAETWRTYHNTRFGTTAQYPAGWTMGPPPQNNDGREFSSPDKRASIVIAGIFSTLPREDEIASRAKPEDGETITYAKRGAGWIVVSGTKGDIIFYRKSTLTCGDTIWNDLSIEYPAADKAKYDALVEHVSASLRGGSGYDAEKCK
jgi:serine/threonine-protein kinase